MISDKLDKAIRESKIYITENGMEVAGAEQLDVIVEATGNPEAGVDHALAAFNVKSHVVLVTVAIVSISPFAYVILFNPEFASGNAPSARVTTLPL